MNPLHEVLTLKEYAELWHVSVDTLKQKCIGTVKGDWAFIQEERTATLFELQSFFVL